MKHVYSCPSALTESSGSDDQSILLMVENLCKNFGGLAALRDYNLTLEKGELVGLIGPNGSGKTTVFNLLSGVIHPTSGKIRFRKVNITVSRPDKNAYLGIARTFQNIRLFENLTVIDNIKAAFHMRHGEGLLPTLFNLKNFKKSEREIEEKSSRIMEILGIMHYRDEIAKNLPYGDQRKVELARSLATEPKLMLLDEPTAGLNNRETEKMMATISEIHKRYSLAILIVEHDMKVIMGICQRIQVIDQGETIALGTPEDIKKNRKVIEAYLGRPKTGLRYHA
ncbi:Lipopolysaccharide export system ATP-binding protein LptB [subsurface metagenome]